MCTLTVKSPGTALKELLKQKDLSQSEAARILGVTQSLLSQMIKGDIRIKPETAVKIERLIGGSAEHFVYAQAAADLAKAREAA